MGDLGSAAAGGMVHSGTVSAVQADGKRSQAGREEPGRDALPPGDGVAPEEQGPPPMPLPIPLQNPRKDGYIGSVRHADVGAAYNQMSVTSTRVIDRVLDVLRHAYVAYG